MTKLKRKTKGNTIAKTTVVPLQSGASSKTGRTVVTGKSPDADDDADANADADDNNGGNNNADANDDDNDSNDNGDKYGDVANTRTTILQSGVSKKGSTTTKKGH